MANNRTNANINMQEVFFFLILIGLAIAFYNIIEPFLTDIFLTMVLVILFKRPYLYFLRKFKERKGRAAGATIILVVFVIVLPLTFMGIIITKEATQNYEIVKEKLPEIKKELTKEKIQSYVDKIPIVNKYIGEIKIEDYKEKLSQIIASVSEYTLYLIQNTFTGIAFMIIHSFIILFLLFFMLVDGKSLIERIQYLIPLKDEDEKEMMRNIVKVTDAIVINSFLIGIIEGTYGGILFAILGISSPFFWGFIMAVLSVIPLVGTNTIIVPMAIFHFIIGDYTTGTLLLILGSGAVIINQNIIRPRLDGNKSGMHTAVVFIASLGGLMWMGIVGFLAGPLLMALFISMINQFGKKYKHKLEEFNKAD